MTRRGTDRVTIGTLLTAIGGVQFFWFSFVDETFMHGNVKPLSWTLLVIGATCTVCGLFLAAGGRLAAAAYAAIGLAEPPPTSWKPGAASETARMSGRIVTWSLSVCALWHLSVGWLFFPIGGYAGDPGAVFRLIFFPLITYGIVPLFLSPFYARMKRWAMWTVCLFYLSVCVFVVVAACFVPPATPSWYSPSLFAVEREVNQGAVVYLLASAVLGALAAFTLVLVYRSRERA